MTLLLPTAYLASVSYYYYLINFPTEIDRHAHYHKQTCANRCQIATAHGIENLTIPMEHTDHTPLHEVRISHHHDWATLHWRALEAAYNASPFFDYYKDDLQPLFLHPAEHLLDFNLALQDKILDLLGYETTYTLSNSYKKNADSNEIDMRNWFNVKKNVVTLPRKFVPQNYYQVFEQKNGFLPDLSIVDLLFNMGNEARLILRKQ